MLAKKDFAQSKDGLRICCEISGRGPVALVFVHGWCCDRSIWAPQVERFAGEHTTISLDLGGHGESGDQRDVWSMQAFAQDVLAVIEALELRRVILVGHSMSGAVIVEAARQAPGTVVGVIGIDTLWDVSRALTTDEIEAQMAPFREEFIAAAREYVRSMFLPSSNAALVEAIVTSMSSASPRVGIGALDEVMRNAANVRRGLEEIEVPITLINSTEWRPTNLEAASAHEIEVILMYGVGHFVMLEDAPRFNTHLAAVVEAIFGRLPQPLAPGPERRS